MNGPTMKFYAGIGSRKTPDITLVTMEGIARDLRRRGYTLRSGGAPGADSAFEAGAGDDKEVYLPWQGFNGKKGIVLPSTPWSQSMVLNYHPNPKALTPGGILLMERNTYQVLGPSLDAIRSEFIVCWTPNAAITGGTGQALRIADDYSIPVFNLALPNTLTNLLAWVDGRR